MASVEPAKQSKVELALLWFHPPHVTVSDTSAHHDELIAECDHSTLLYEIKCIAQVSGFCPLSFHPTPNHLKSFRFAISKNPAWENTLRFRYTKPRWHLNVKPNMKESRYNACHFSDLSSAHRRLSRQNYIS